MSLKRRSDSLGRITRFCEQLAEGIRYTAAPLEDLLCSLASTAEFQKFPLLQAAQLSDDPRRSLLTSLERHADELGLNTQDKQMFEEFIVDFGAADLAGEVQRCGRYAVLFRERYAAAREIVCRKGRLYVTLGLCGGCTLSLVLV